MDENIANLKQYIEKDIENKSFDFFSEKEIDKSYIVTEFVNDTNKTVRYNNLLDLLLNASEQNKFAILGNGGQGKSQFLKMLYKDLYQNDKLPIFISLQDFGLWQKENTQRGLLEYIKYLTGFEIDNIKTKVIIQANNLNNTVNKDFYLLLDGLDEYCGNYRNLLNNELFRNKLNFNIIIASRNTCSMYLNNFDLLNIQAFSTQQILEYLLFFLDKPNADKLYSAIKSKDDLYTLSKTPLFLALLCRIYKSNPESINTIHSKSDFIQQIFDVLCNEKLIDKTNRKELLEELCSIAYNLKLNSEICSPSHELLKLQLLVPVGNTYQFVHKLFEDYYSALFLANNGTVNDFLDYKNDIYNIFSANWKQTIIFWFGIETISDKEKIKCFNKILKFKDKTSGWYQKRAFLLCCEILGEYNNIPENNKKKLLNKFIDLTKDYYNLTDDNEVKENKKNKDTIYLLDLANVTYNTDRKCLCNLLYNKLEKAWQKRDNKAPFTTYINRLANLNYNTTSFKNLLLEIYKERNGQYAPDLYQKAFKSCAYGDIKTIEFFIERLENPLKYDFQKIREGWYVRGVIDVLSDIIPNNSEYVNRLYKLYQNEALANQYGENKTIFTGKLKSFLRDKATNEDILKELGEPKPISKAAQIHIDIKSYLETNNNSNLENVLQTMEYCLEPFSIMLEEAFENIKLEKQKEFLKIILFDNKFQKYQKSIFCMLAHPKYKENNYIIELFNTVKIDTDNDLYDNLPCLAYVAGMITKSEEIISQAISILKEHIKNNVDDFECIDWLGHIALEHTKFKDTIIEFLKSIQYTDDKAIIYAMFYIDIDDQNKREYKNCLMNLILDKNKKDKRNDYLLDLYQNCLNCPNNDDLVEFSIKLIKSIPLKNTLSRNFILFISHISNSIIWNINTFKLKFKNKTIKKIICFVGNIFVNIENAINRKYFNHRFIYLDNWFIRNYITKDNQAFILKSLKRENYSTILCYLAYEMDYIDSYKIYHPIIFTITQLVKMSVKKSKDLFICIVNFYSNNKKIIDTMSIILFIFFCITIFLKEQNKPLSFTNYAKTFIHKQIKDYE